MSKRMGLIAGLSLFAILHCFAQGELSGPVAGILGSQPGTYAHDQILFPDSLASAYPIRYRFSQKDEWKAFDRPIYLSAFPGELRQYNLEFFLSGSEQVVKLAYNIDKQAPEPPLFGIPSGDAGNSVTILLDSKEDIFLSINGGPFSVYDKKNPPVFEAAASHSSIIHAEAYSMDVYGNCSRSVSTNYRLFPENFKPSFPFSLASSGWNIMVQDKAEDLSARLTDANGYLLLEVSCAFGTFPAAAVNAVNPFETVSAFSELSGSNTGKVTIAYPWGYENEITVHYGYRNGNTLVVAREPLRVKPAFSQAASIGPPSKPPAPLLRSSGESILVDWPQSPWQMMYSLDGTNFKAFSKPVNLPAAEAKNKLFYYASGSDKASSEVSSVELPAMADLSVPELLGLDNGATYGPSLYFKPATDKKLRYELVTGEEVPPALNADSQILDDKGLKLIGKPGRVVNYALRLGAVSDMAGLTPESLYFFSVDREAPPLPSLKNSPDSYLDDDFILEFEKQDGTIYVSVSEDGNGSFVPYKSPITINGSKDRNTRYIVRAYSEDEFGNRSREITPLKFMIDPSSVYVDSNGRKGAAGTPKDPMPGLEDALVLAQRLGKRFIKLRGQFLPEKSMDVYSSLSIYGGFDNEWKENPNEKASIKSAVAGNFLFVAENSSLDLRNLDIITMLESSKGVLSSINGNIALKNVSMSLSGGIEKTAIKALSSKIVIEDSFVFLDSMFTARAIDAADTVAKLKNCSISAASKLGMFEAINMNRGTAEISGLRIEAEPSLASSVLSAHSSVIKIGSSFLLLKGKQASQRIFAVQDSKLDVNSVYLDMNTDAFSEAISVLRNSHVNLLHLTAMINAPKLVFINLSASGLTLANSIVISGGTESVLIRADSPLPPAAVSANCLWGFTTFLDGKSYAAPIKSIELLNRTAKPDIASFLESPSRTFGSTEKGIRRLSISSLCVDGAVYKNDNNFPDLFGKDRGVHPDIGAEEL